MKQDRPRVVVTRKLPDVIETRMMELFDVQLNLDDHPMTKAELFEAVRTADVLVCTVTDRIDSELLSQKGENLHLIANYGTGVDHIDLASARQQGITGDRLLQMLELRLDNVVYRLGFAASRAQARQIIRHGHFKVNGGRVDIPSYRLRRDDIISLKPQSPVEQVVRDATDLTASVPAWLEADHDNLSARVLKTPERIDIDAPIEEQLIVELYSK